jgi:hypothetical protein
MSILSHEDQTQEFLNKKVKIIFEPIVCALLVDKPKDPVLY